MRRLLRLWFALGDPVSGRTYLRHGAGLMLAKYAVDMGLVFLATAQWWTPLNYLNSVSFLLSTKFQGAPPWLVPVLAVWTLPFVWIGATMTLRRLLDASWSAWWCLLFFVPYLNYALMLLLTLLPSVPAPERQGPAAEPRHGALPGALLVALGAGLAVGIGMLGVSVLALRLYGPSLFLGTPFLIGVLTGFFFNRRIAASRRETIQVTLMALALVAGVAFLLGQEGAICIAMAIPLALIPATLGAIIGREIAGRHPAGIGPAALSALALPFGTLALPQASPPVLREVETSVIIAAPREAVWRNVLAFPPLPEPGVLLKRSGIAYPRSARLVGAGLGAVRYCVFSTGSFVEPITAWEPGARLAFDVIVSPPPMREWSIYARVTPPHLDGYLTSRRGEFRLLPTDDGRTRLEGRTWYELRIEPQGYWVLLSDYLIHRIHERVLTHIRREAERGAGAP